MRQSSSLQVTAQRKEEKAQTCSKCYDNALQEGDTSYHDMKNSIDGEEKGPGGEGKLVGGEQKTLAVVFEYM